ncbi:MAG: tetratricopeptide repeat protein [Cyanobacteria bacterium P01_A01_bin.80]
MKESPVFQTGECQIGRVYDDLGEKQEALSYYNQALPLLRVVGDKVGVGCCC